MLAHRDTITINLIEESNPEFITNGNGEISANTEESKNPQNCRKKLNNNGTNMTCEELFSTFTLNLKKKVDFERRKLNFQNIKMGEITLTPG